MKLTGSLIFALLPSFALSQGTPTKLFLQQYQDVAWMHMPSIFEAGNGTTCSQPPADPPLPSSILNAAVIDGSIVLCGGYYNPYCFTLFAPLNVWFEFDSMDVARVYAASVMTPYGWWVTGGSSENVHGQSSSSLWDGTSWVAGPDLPSERNGHCMVQVSDSLTFVAGGLSDSAGGHQPDAHMFDWTTETWSTLPNLTAPMTGMACALYRDGMGGHYIMVAGNQRPGVVGNCSALSLDLGNPQEWQVLPDILLEGETFAGVFVQDGNDLVLINRYLGNILRFNPSDQTFSSVQSLNLTIVGFDVAVLPVEDGSLYGCG